MGSILGYAMPAIPQRTRPFTLVWLLVAGLFLTACSESASPVVRSHDAYIWQRQWTPALKSAMMESASRIRAWHVLAAETDAVGRLSVFAPGKEMLHNGKPVVLVVRFNHALSATEWDPLIVGIADLLGKWRRADPPVIGLEIDYDAPTAQLREYAHFLAELRPVLDKNVRITLTALPAWLRSPILLEVLQQADEAVLQVHAVANPRLGLFNRQQALRWIEEFAAETPVPFRVALPTYGSRVGWDETGKVVVVESETALPGRGVVERELSADPREVRGLLDDLARKTIPLLLGPIWFRLPTDDDRRAWSLATWHGVIDGAPLEPRLGVRAVMDEASGASDIRIANDGNLDAALPNEVFVQCGSCQEADALEGYLLQRVEKGFYLRLSQPQPLKAKQQRTIAWVRCAVEKVGFHAP
ncbi:MAG: DUF3142 domain-containing protein [Magnetococcales bacterium]|nr:DUF3142 domain-containing protein [Magnetococcales bacterium]